MTETKIGNLERNTVKALNLLYARKEWIKEWDREAADLIADHATGPLRELLADMHKFTSGFSGRKVDDFRIEADREE